MRCHIYPWLTALIQQVVIAIVPDYHCWFGSGLKPNNSQNGGAGCQYSRTANSCTVLQKSPNKSDIGGLPVGCAAGSFVDSDNAVVSAV